MKKSTLKKLLIGFVLLIITFILIFKFTQSKRFENWLASRTIPFNLVVNPNTIDKGTVPKSIKLSGTNPEKDKKTAVKITADINKKFDEKDQNYYFLDRKQRKKLRDDVKSKPHQYIYSFTLINFGKDLNRKYLTVSANRYDDTEKIKGYDYKLYYNKKKKITKAVYIKTTSSKSANKFVYEKVPVGNNGLSSVSNFKVRMKNTLTNLGINGLKEESYKYNEALHALGLSNDSYKSFVKFSSNSTSNFNNSAIQEYYFKDVPRTTTFVVTQHMNHKTYHYRLIYNRNKQKFTSFKAY